MKFLFIIIVLLCSFIIACKDNSKNENKVETTTGDSIQSVDRKTDSLLKIENFQDSIRLVQSKDSILLKTTQNILTLLKNKNYSAFANYIHPVEGIRFSPYGFVDTVHDIKLSKQKFINQAGESMQDMIVWGDLMEPGIP